MYKNIPFLQEKFNVLILRIFLRICEKLIILLSILGHKPENSGIYAI